MLLLGLPSTVFSQNSTPCETVKDCRTRLATAKRVAQDAIDKAREAEAREAAAVQQRNVAIDENEQCQKDRDHEAQKAADAAETVAETVAAKEAAEVKLPPLIVSNTLLEAQNRRLKRQRWVFAGGGAVATVVIAAVGFIVFETVTP